jgi:hypothetical protein
MDMPIRIFLWFIKNSWFGDCYTAHRHNQPDYGRPWERQEAWAIN